jgi:hypothetical protein
VRWRSWLRCAAVSRPRSWPEARPSSVSSFKDRS